MSTGAVSVRPYPTCCGRPATSANRAAVALGSGAAPQTATRTDAIAATTVSRSASAQARNIDGTPTSTLTRCRASSASAPVGPRSSTSTPVAPWWTAAPSPEFNPYAWKSGSASSTVSSGPTTGGVIRPTCSWLAASARCDSIAPLGQPSVPEV